MHVVSAALIDMDDEGWCDLVEMESVELSEEVDDGMEDQRALVDNGMEESALVVHNGVAPAPGQNTNILVADRSTLTVNDNGKQVYTVTHSDLTKEKIKRLD